jgi:hypothetical protein
VLAACAEGGPAAGDADELLRARILPSPLPDLMIEENIQVRLEAETRGGARHRSSTPDWSLSDGSGRISPTGVLTAERSGIVSGRYEGLRAEATFTVLPFPNAHPTAGTWRVSQWVRSATTGDPESFDLLASGYLGVSVVLSAIDQGRAYGRLQLQGTGPDGATLRSSGTAIAAHPDRVRLLLLPDGGTPFPLTLEEAWFRWEVQDQVLRLTQIDETAAWRFPSGRVRGARDLIRLSR